MMREDVSQRQLSSSSYLITTHTRAHAHTHTHITTHTHTHTHTHTQGQEAVTGVIGQGDLSKTVLLSLIHLKRVDIVPAAGFGGGGGGGKAYKTWK